MHFISHQISPQTFAESSFPESSNKKLAPTAVNVAKRSQEKVVGGGGGDVSKQESFTMLTMHHLHVKLDGFSPLSTSCYLLR